MHFPVIRDSALKMQCEILLYLTLSDSNKGSCFYSPTYIQCSSNLLYHFNNSVVLHQVFRSMEGTRFIDDI